MSNAINLIDKLVSVDASNCSGMQKLQTHKHTFTCDKNKNYSRSTGGKCRFGAPFMPSKATKILIPMPLTDTRRSTLHKIYLRMWNALEENDYENMDTFLAAHNVQSEDTYLDILRAGITRPMVILKRETSEKWINPFNPFIFSVLRSNMDMQFITEEYSCAAYVVEYVNKTNRGISNLQQNIINVMDEHPEFDIIEITRQLGVNFLNTVELTSQESAWYLLRQPMSQSSVQIVYIPTLWPTERERIRKTNAELDRDEIDGESCDIWRENVFDKYQNRPSNLENVSLAQFASKYTYNRGEWKLRLQPRIIRFRNYDISSEQNNYKREMVTLHLAFRDEENELLAEHKYLQLYDDNDVLIMERRKDFESSLDIAKTLEICRNMCLEFNDINVQAEEDVNILGVNVAENDGFADFLQDPNAEINADIRIASLSRLGSIAKKREDIMAKEDFNRLMRTANVKQKGLLLHVIAHILDHNADAPIQIFITGPAGCGKTFVIHLLKEIYNRFSHTQGFCNAFMTCAPTGKAAVAIGGTTIHTAFKIAIARNSALSFETLQQYRSLLKNIASIIIDEISMISAELNEKIDVRLKQITAINKIYGGKDVFLIGDLRQLPPVRATPIYKQTRQSLAGPTLWRSMKYYELSEVMRQSNADFAAILTKIGNGEILTECQQNLIETRFFTNETVSELCASGIRLFFRNQDVQEYNRSVLNEDQNKVTSLATDIFSGYNNAEQLAFCRQKFNKMSIIDTGGLPYELTLVLNKPYMITSNIDVSDGLANGAVGVLAYIEFFHIQNNGANLDNDSQISNHHCSVKRLWMKFSGNEIGEKTKRRSAFYASRINITTGLVPICRRNSTTHLNSNRTINVKRSHFPLVAACAMTIHKAQGATFEQVVYKYDKSHDQQLVYVALSRVTALEGLFIVAAQGEHVFHHGKRPNKRLDSLRLEFARLSSNLLKTVQDDALEFIQTTDSMAFMTFNCQSLRAHQMDLNDIVVKSCHVLLLTETWLPNEDNIVINDFECCVQYKRPESRSGGVAIYKRKMTTDMPSQNINIIMQETSQRTSIGDIASIHLKLPTGQEIICVAIYISPNQSVQNIIKFLHSALSRYTEIGSQELQEDYFSMPIIMGGDFNTNFSTAKAQPLIQFLYDKFKLVLNTSPESPTTIQGTTIDAVFSRYLNSVDSKVYVSYFSYHRPILSVLKNLN